MSYPTHVRKKKPKRRLGKFRLTMDLVRGCPEIWAEIKDRVKIHQARPTEDRGVNEYEGESVLFEEMNSEDIPLYRFEFSKKEGKIITIEAIKVKEDGFR